MFDLTPVKLLLLFIVAMILLGPDKLPQLARQLGAGWRRLQGFREQMDREIRQNIPDLPSSSEIARFARSPMSLLDQLAQMSPEENLVEDGGAAAVDGDGGGSLPEDRSALPAEPGRSGPALPPPPDDPSLN